MRYLLPLLILAACADSADDRNDAAADGAPLQATDGKADGVDYTGLYHISSSTWHSNDITDLELRNGGIYVRARCYYGSCGEQLAQTDKYDVYTSSAGYTYVRFWQSDRIADVYQIKKISKGISLRKAHTTRWFSLFVEVPSAACASSGGTWSDTCSCPNSQYSDQGYEAFVPGAGGCIWAPSGSEQACDDSGGSYTDDEATPISTYCVCPFGQFVDTDGSCVDI